MGMFSEVWVRHSAWYPVPDSHRVPDTRYRVRAEGRIPSPTRPSGLHP